MVGIAIAGQLFGTAGAIAAVGLCVLWIFFVVDRVLGAAAPRRLRLYAVLAAGGTAIVLFALVSTLRPAHPALSGPVDLRGRTISQSTVDALNLQGSQLAGARLDGRNLRRNSLAGATAVGASFVRARLDRVSMRGANLRGADLSGACLSYADLTGAILTGTNVEGAYASGAMLTPGKEPDWVGALAGTEPEQCH